MLTRLTSLTLIDDGRRDSRVTLSQLMPLTALTWLLKVQITGLWAVEPLEDFKRLFSGGGRSLEAPDVTAKPRI